MISKEIPIRQDTESTEETLSTGSTKVSATHEDDDKKKQTATFSENRANGKRRRNLCIIWCLCVFVLIAIGMLLWYFLVYLGEDDGVAICGNCHCIVGAANETCPVQRKPRTNFTMQDIEIWASLEVLNPYTISCDPYEDADCQTNPPQSQELLALGDVAVCAIHFEENTTTFTEGGTSCENAKYRLQSYASFEDAKTAGGFVTHAGHCGVCSTLQDLATYIRATDLTTQGKWCAAQGAFSPEGGRKCYRDLGLTEDCAEMWAHNSWNTAKNCFKECVIEEGTIDNANNGPAPTCALNDCLQCDEDKSGPAFRHLAGRTRRRSGLLSAIARPCSHLISISQEACPKTLPLVV